MPLPLTRCPTSCENPQYELDRLDQEVEGMGEAFPPHTNNRMTCRCSKLSIGESRNWNPDCPEHGVGTAWYTSDEQVAKRKAMSERTRDLQRQAREARKRARETQA